MRLVTLGGGAGSLLRMMTRAAALMRTRHGLITHRQALECGVDERTIRRQRRVGAWVRLRRGVYADAEVWHALDPYRGKPLLNLRAAQLTLSCRYVFSHDSAALIHGMGVPDAVNALVHVTRKKVHGDAVRAGIKHHLAPYDPEQVLQVDGFPVLDLARTALDLAREHGLVAGVAGCDHALRRGVTRAELRVSRGRMWCWPQSRVMDEALDLADGGAESWLESEGRVFIAALGLGQPLQTQFGLTDGFRTVWCDLRVGRQIFEFDGKLKYDEDNASGAPPVEVLWHEKQRQDFVTGFKLGVSRLTTHDLRGGRAAAEVRARREFDDTCARFGTDITDLAPYIVRRPRPL